ncbi:MAG: 8-amino-7-oxononanoate synthase [Verrucomicrobia bacterium]|nr:8-amino-7-oxononanoate synthase [Verrucomicrobiota bacterium]
MRFLETHLQNRRTAGTLRSLRSTSGLIDLTSNDYLGFSRSLQLPEKSEYLGATGSRLLTGQHPFYEELEEHLAHFHLAQSCLIYNSGYTANLGLIAALGRKGTTFLYDKEVHASMIDGLHLSKAKSLSFRHNDLVALEKRLKESSSPLFVLVESLYSLSGDFAPLQEIAPLCSHYGAALIVDEAHATGVCGLNGEGRVVELGLESQVFARIHTFSKALGCHGACVLGNQLLKEYLINFSRPFIYTTALPLPSLALIQASYAKLQKEGQRHQNRLKSLIAYFQKRSGRPSSPSPIQPIAIPTAEQARDLSQKLQKQGLDIRLLLPPTTPKGKAVLRLVLHSFNREEEIDQCLAILE